MKPSILLLQSCFHFFEQDKPKINSLIDPATPLDSKPEGISGNWNLDFSDEFNRTTINPLNGILP